MRKRLALAIVAIALALLLAVAVFGRTSPSPSHVKAAHPSPATDGKVATQPPFAPGVHDPANIVSCLKALPPVTVTYGPGPLDSEPDVMSAERLAFSIQATAYDDCTGRNFERSELRTVNGCDGNGDPVLCIARDSHGRLTNGR